MKKIRYIVEPALVSQGYCYCALQLPGISPVPVPVSTPKPVPALPSSPKT